MSKIKLNIGCGNRHFEDFINIDISDRCNPELVLDLSKEAFPYKDNSVQEIIANDFFEHILYPVPVFNECWRVLGADGKMHVEVPLAGTNEFWKDPTHVRGFVPETFKYLSEYAPIFDMYDIKQWSIISLTEGNDRIVVEMRPVK